MDGGAKVDWMDEILQTPFNQTYSINLRGGSANTSYIASFDYTSNEGIVKRSKVDMIYPRINIVHRMFDNKLKVEANLNGYQRKYDIGYSNDVYQSALIFNPTSPIKDENGNWTEIARDMIFNPVALLNETKGENKTTNLRVVDGVVDAKRSPLTGTRGAGRARNELVVHYMPNHIAGDFPRGSGTLRGCVSDCDRLLPSSR